MWLRFKKDLSKFIFKMCKIFKVLRPSLRRNVVVVVLHWPPVRAVWPNYELVEFQLQSVTALDLGSFSYCYVAKYSTLPHTPLLPSKIPLRENPSLTISFDTARFTSAQDYLPAWVSPVPIPSYLSHANYTLAHLLPPPYTPPGFPSPPPPCFFRNIF